MQLEETKLNRINYLQGECRVWRIRKTHLFKQYSMAKNLTKNDNNTKFFHGIASMNKIHNLISKIAIGDIILEEVDEVKRGVRDFYWESYKKEPLPKIKLPHGVFKSFSQPTVSMLDEIQTPDEIKRVVWSCDPDKAPSYDGYNIRFIKPMWSTVGMDITKFVQTFFIFDEFPM